MAVEPDRPADRPPDPSADRPTDPPRARRRRKTPAQIVPTRRLELSIGDYVVSGGELPAMIVIDAVLRLLPGAIDEASPVDESFSHGLLEYAQYTRPPEFRRERVPDVLVSDDHGAVETWRREQALERTKRRRRDLL